MIERLKIDNFKSLVDFDIKLSNFNCIVGLNGSGKSTLLQAIDFISNLMTGDIDGWLDRRGWKAADINSKLSKKSNINFELQFTLSMYGDITWRGTFNRTLLKCTEESIIIEHQAVFKVKDNKVALNLEQNVTPTSSEIFMDYQGSLLSVFKSSKNTVILEDIKSYILNIHSLDLVSPELLRQKNRTASGRLGLGGEHLSAYLHESGDESKQQLTLQLHNLYKQLDKIETRALRSGWKELEITEHFGDQTIKSSARHINDGMLRLMAIFSQLDNTNAFLLFDEIENGINPELIEYLLDHLVKTDKQILITTHSPMILNFLEDNIAREGVIYLYKNSKGITKAKRLFDIPSLDKKLNMMGPGEAFIDTDLTQLYKEIATLDTIESFKPQGVK